MKAKTKWSCGGWSSSSTAAYPFGTSDYEVSVDSRGKVTTTACRSFADREETVSYDGYVSNVVTSIRGGGSSTRREWTVERPANGAPQTAWTEERRFDEYDADGRRVSYSVTESSDCGVVTNSVTAYDHLGRIVCDTRATSDVSYAYDGASSRVAWVSDEAGGVATECLYNDFGEAVGVARNGVTNRTDVAYEVVSNVLCRVTTNAITAWRAVPSAPSGGTRSVASVTKERLAGLSDELRSETFEYRNGALANHA